VPVFTVQKPSGRGVPTICFYVPMFKENKPTDILNRRPAIKKKDVSANLKTIA